MSPPGLCCIHTPVRTAPPSAHSSPSPHVRCVCACVRLARCHLCPATPSAYAAHVQALASFDCGALFDALDAKRREQSLGWYELADALWEQSAILNARRGDHPICGGAIQRLEQRGTISCQYALFMLRWLREVPEAFLVGPVVDVGRVRLPKAGAESRLRWSLDELHAALDARRRAEDHTWSGLADGLGCTPSRLTNLRKARLADMDLVMRITQWLGEPSAAFIHPADW